MASLNGVLVYIVLGAITRKCKYIDLSKTKKRSLTCHFEFCLDRADVVRFKVFDLLEKVCLDEICR